MSFKFYIDPTSHDLFRYDFETKELSIFTQVDKVRILAIGEVVEDEDYRERGGYHPAAKTNGFTRKRNADNVSDRERVKDLSNEGMDASDIHEATGISLHFVRSYRSKLLKAGEIKPWRDEQEIESKPEKKRKKKGQKICKKCGMPGHMAKTCKNESGPVEQTGNKEVIQDVIDRAKEHKNSIEIANELNMPIEEVQKIIKENM